MLLSLIIGKSKTDITNEWGLFTDSYDNNFIVNETTRQRIRLGKKVNTKCEKVMDKENFSAYDIATNTFFSNNNKNMNLILMNFWSEDKEVKKNHEDDNILYINILNSDYKIISYDCGDNKILQTYYKTNDYQGLAVVFKGLNKDVFSFRARNNDINKYVDVVVNVDENGVTSYTETEVTDSRQIQQANNYAKKLGKKIKNFTIKTEGFPTNTFIVDPLLRDKVEETIESNVPNHVIIVADNNAFSDNLSEEEREDIRRTFKECITDERVRAITVVGVRIPQSFLKEYNILYVFNYDITTDTITCIKSK